MCGPDPIGFISLWKETSGNSCSCSLSAHTYSEKAMWGHSKNTAICKPGTEPSPETEWPEPYLGLPAYRRMRNKFLLSKPTSLWYFVMAAQAE